jgi:hypothetical protein
MAFSLYFRLEKGSSYQKLKELELQWQVRSQVALENEKEGYLFDINQV